MRNLTLLLTSFVLCLFISCSSSKEEQKAVEVPTEEVATLAPETEVTTPANETTSSVLALNTMIRGKYLSAAVYAGATDYVFELDDGEQITIRVSNTDDIGNPEVPEILLESEEEVDGPPGANPKMIGKYVTIEKDKDDNYLRVIYSMGKRKGEAPEPEKTSFRAKYNSVKIDGTGTDYEFIKEDGQKIIVRISDFENAKNPGVPKNLLEPEEGLGGRRPGVNPEMVGKYFMIEQYVDGAVLKVKPI